jgi:hypothetical protein
MTDDITQRLRVTMPDFKGIEISCPCRIRSLLMREAADEIEKLTRERDEARAEVERLRDALRDALDGLRYWVPQTSVGAVEKCRIMEKGIEALEVKSAVERCRFMENGIEALEVNP